jgi:3-oxoacyl-[acyl-carrier-protein] synthase-3
MTSPEAAPRARILGTGAYLPGEPVDNAQLSHFFGGDIVRVAEALGGETRHLALDLSTKRLKPGETNANMAYRAGLAALDDADLTARDIDLLILSTATPDYPFPATALFVQDLFGLNDAQVIELRAGCGGMAQAFTIAELFIKNRHATHALLIGSELISPFHDLLTQGANTEKGHLVATAMFGDGAGAVVMGPSGDERGILGSMFGSVGGGQAPGMLLRAGGAISPGGMDVFGEGPAFVHDFRAIMQKGPELVDRGLEWVRTCGLAPLDEVTYYVPPQASGRIIDTVAAKTNLHGAQGFSNFSRVGNTASASIYIALDELNRTDRLHAGDCIALLPSEATKWTYGGILVRW